jgi:hypothetical protein
MKLRSQRNKAVKVSRSQKVDPNKPVNAGA